MNTNTQGAEVFHNICLEMTSIAEELDKYARKYSATTDTEEQAQIIRNALLHLVDTPLFKWCRDLAIELVRIEQLEGEDQLPKFRKLYEVE